METTAAAPLMAPEPPIASTSAVRLDDNTTASSAFSAPPPRTDTPSPPPMPATTSNPSAFHPFAPPAADDDLSLLLSSELQPLENATLTIRCIKSFEYRTAKNLVLKGLNLRELTVDELLRRCKEALKTAPGFKAYRTVDFDTLKLYTQAHSHKTMNLIINLDHDDWILSNPHATLASVGAVNETEYSLFNRGEYERFKANPEIKWD